MNDFYFLIYLCLSNSPFKNLTSNSFQGKSNYCMIVNVINIGRKGTTTIKTGETQEVL